ncbi:hypothetical protein [Gordonia insulae]|uniref:Uncharacterized protein n=1 Tax=Gordonia insulae TaxID=2420509 RepID=A0A3G8JUM3_9ACTN|nr:hypothetical protein [Gordonia insulae]AZG48222.1 hypothetical protein D7316_04839 [Gordonia insulae]
MAVDKAKSKAVSEVVRQHPGMSLAAVSPGIALFLIVGVLVNWPLAILLGLVGAGAGYYFLTRQK